MNITDKYFTKTIKNMIKKDQCQIISLSVNAGTVYSIYTGLFSPNVIICPYTVQLETVLSHIEIIQIHADVLKIDTVKILIYACPQ